MRQFIQRHIRLTALFLSLTGLCAFGLKAHAQMAATNNHHTYMNGETLKIAILGEEELSKEYTIDDDGMILMPLIGKIPASGKTKDEIKEVITTSLQDGYIHNPVISIKSMEERVFYIIGQIKVPGQYTIPKHKTSILHAVALAGGFTPFANKDKFELVRENEQTTPQKYSANANIEILPGDIIIVKKSFF